MPFILERVRLGAGDVAAASAAYARGAGAGPDGAMVAGRVAGTVAGPVVRATHSPGPLVRQVYVPVAGRLG